MQKFVPWVIDDNLALANEQPHCYNVLEAMYALVSYQLLENLKGVQHFGSCIDKFKASIIDDTLKDFGANYDCTDSAQFIISAWTDVKNYDPAEHVYMFCNFDCYTDYIHSGGKAKLTYKQALELLPSSDHPFYQFSKSYWDSARQALEDIRDIRGLIKKHFKRLPADMYRYNDIKALYKEILNMYAYEVVFNYYYM